MISKVGWLVSWLVVVTMLKLHELLNRDSNFKMQAHNKFQIRSLTTKICCLPLSCMRALSVCCVHISLSYLDLQKLKKQSELRAKGARGWRWQPGSSEKKLSVY